MKEREREREREKRSWFLNSTEESMLPLSGAVKVKRLSNVLTSDCLLGCQGVCRKTESHRKGSGLFAVAAGFSFYFSFSLSLSFSLLSLFFSLQFSHLVSQYLLQFLLSLTSPTPQISKQNEQSCEIVAYLRHPHHYKAIAEQLEWACLLIDLLQISNISIPLLCPRAILSESLVRYKVLQKYEKFISFVEVGVVVDCCLLLFERRRNICASCW